MSRRAGGVRCRGGVAGAGHGVEAELGAGVGGGGQRAAVEGDAGRVGDAGEPVDRADRPARLEQAGRTDGGEQRPAGRRQVRGAAVGGGGEGEQERAIGDPDAVVEGRGQLDGRAER